MTHWLHDRYISREQHQQIVEYYRKLVANLQHTICELKTRVDADNLEKIDDVVSHAVRAPHSGARKSQPLERYGNVIRLDFSKRR